MRARQHNKTRQRFAPPEQQADDAAAPERDQHQAVSNDRNHRSNQHHRPDLPRRLARQVKQTRQTFTRRQQRPPGQPAVNQHTAREQQHDHNPPARRQHRVVKLGKPPHKLPRHAVRNIDAPVMIRQAVSRKQQHQKIEDHRRNQQHQPPQPLRDHFNGQQQPAPAQNHQPQRHADEQMQNHQHPPLSRRSRIKPAENQNKNQTEAQMKTIKQRPPPQRGQPDEMPEKLQQVFEVKH